MDKTQSSSLHSSTTSNSRYGVGRVAGGGSAIDKTQSSSLHSSRTSNNRYGLWHVAGGGDCGGCLLWIKLRAEVYIPERQVTAGMVFGVWQWEGTVMGVCYGENSEQWSSFQYDK